MIKDRSGLVGDCYCHLLKLMRLWFVLSLYFSCRKQREQRGRRWCPVCKSPADAGGTGLLAASVIPRHASRARLFGAAKQPRRGRFVLQSGGPKERRCARPIPPVS